MKARWRREPSAAPRPLRRRRRRHPSPWAQSRPSRPGAPPAGLRRGLRPPVTREALAMGAATPHRPRRRPPMPGRKPPAPPSQVRTAFRSACAGRCHGCMLRAVCSDAGRQLWIVLYELARLIANYSTLPLMDGRWHLNLLLSAGSQICMPTCSPWLQPWFQTHAQRE